ncbi:recombinase family protein [Elizabethkingia anophelis]|uniref:recombinase family protein n=1 Tax=Elizabethkingia anophelis TaxID=1117645 RepID=UPI00320AFF6B
MVVDLYIRVSTDDQADKGYSQRDQNERLRKYCELKNFTIDQVIYEDHSAKNFERPEWIKYLIHLRKRSTKTNRVLFTKWDRFSRNAGDAYQMIAYLGKLGVEPQAIEQPLDLSIPENKLMLALYLSTPEVENDRRALNTSNGMRRAMKEGRWMGKAPYGYINKSREDGSKYVAIVEPEGSNMKWAFNEIAKGTMAISQVRERMNEREGKRLEKTAFYIGLRNPMYCGKIFIKKNKEEEAHFVRAQHEPLISEELFEKVQSVLKGKRAKTATNTKFLSDENLPLRGFLLCPVCGGNITGSASSGRRQKYYYYHCQPPCRFRHRADAANLIFSNGLKDLEIKESLREYIKKKFLENYKASLINPVEEKKRIGQEIDELSNKLSFAREKWLSKIIDDDEYVEIKKECKEQIEKLEEKLSKDEGALKNINVDTILEKAFHGLISIGFLYDSGDIETKREIIGLIFPDKLKFDGKNYRTTKMDILARHIFQINSDLDKNKKRKSEQISCFSFLITPKINRSNHFINDLERIS